MMSYYVKFTLISIPTCVHKCIYDTSVRFEFIKVCTRCFFFCSKMLIDFRSVLFFTFPRLAKTYGYNVRKF